MALTPNKIKRLHIKKKKYGFIKYQFLIQYLIILLSVLEANYHRRIKSRQDKEKEMGISDIYHRLPPSGPF